jgi:hypothetical protein
MKPKTRKLLIAGVALLIFGPVLGFVLYFVGMFLGFQSLATAAASPPPPGTLPDIGHMMSSMFTRMFVGFAPLLVGMLAGASGMFLIIFSLITHFTGPKDG